MKLSNNAIKFLMAQYRAIYKNAYVKGLATAVILTAGLAAAQAQAASITDIANLASGEDATLTGGSNDKLAIAAKGEGAWNKNITIKGATADSFANNITATGGNIALSGTATLTIQETTKPENGLLIKGEGGTASVLLGQVDLNGGTIKLENSKAKTSLSADTINIGMSGTKASNIIVGDATQTAAANSAVLGSSAAVINLGKSGSITISGKTAAGTAVVEGQLNSTGGTVAFSGDVSTGTLKTWGTAEDLNITVKSGANTGAKGTIELTDIEKTADKNEGLLTIQSGNITIEGEATAAKAGTLTISKGTIDLGKGVVIAAPKAANAKLAVGDTATLKATKTQLTDFLATDKGMIAVTAKGTIFLKPEGEATSVDIGGLKFKNGTDEAGSLNFADGGTIAADNMLVSAALAGTATNTIIKANDTLTIGKDTTFKTGLGVKSAQAKNLTLASTDAFELDKSITLQALSTEAAVNNVVKAETGTITGKALLKTDGSIVVNGGDYTASGDITVSGGSLEVKNDKVGGASSSTTASSSTLTLAAGSKLVLDHATEATNAVKVTGSGSMLDLTKAEITYANPALESGKQKKVTLTADNATIRMKSADFQTLMTAASDSGSVFAVTNKDAKLELVGDLEVRAGVLKNANRGVQISKSGTMLVEGDVNLTGVTTAAGVDLGAANAVDANLVANKITVTADAGVQDTDVISLKSGSFTVVNGLEGGTSAGFAIDSKAALNLGNLKQDAKGAWSTDNAEGGAVDAALEVKGDGALNVQAGSWNLAGLKVSAGAATVGNAAALKDKDGKDLAVSLKTSSMELAGGTTTVYANADVNTTTLNAAANALKVSGSMTINGNSNTDTAKDINGLKLAASSVTLSSGGKLTFGSNIANSEYSDKASGDGIFGFTKSGTSITAVDVNDNVFAAGAIAAEQGSEITFQFGEDKIFNKDGLKSLKHEILATPDAFKGVINLGSGNIEALKVEKDESGNSVVSWSGSAADYADVLPNITNDEYKNAQLTGISGSVVTGHWGSFNCPTATGAFKVDKNTSLNNAATVGNDKIFTVGSGGKAMGITVEANSVLALNNGGKAGVLTLGSGSELAINASGDAVTELEGLKAEKGSVSIDGNTVVAKDFKAGELTLNRDLTVKSGTATIGMLTSTAEKAGNLKVDVLKVDGNGTEAGKIDYAGSIEANKATFGDEAVLSGNLKLGESSFTREVTLSGKTNALGKTSFADTATVSGGQTAATEVSLSAGKTLNVKGGADFTADVLTAGSGSVIMAGSAAVKAEGQTPAVEGTSGFITVGRVDLKGGEIVADPDYGTASSIVAVKAFGTAEQADGTRSGFNAGVINGKVYALKNSIIAIGSGSKDEVISTFGKYFDENGSLREATGTASEVSAVAFVNGSVKIDSGSSIVVDSAVDNKSYKETAAQTAYGSNSVYLGKNSALAVHLDAIGSDKAAITLGATDATIKAADTSARILLAGKGFSVNKKLDLFDGAAPDAKVTLQIGDAATAAADGKAALAVETINGLYRGELVAGEVQDGITLKFDSNAAAQRFSSISEPVRQSLFAYANGYVNADAATEAEKGQVRGALVSDFVAQDGKVYAKGADGKADTQMSEALLNKKLEEAGLYNARTRSLNFVADEQGNVYQAADNSVLNYVLGNSTTGVEAEAAARLADLGGASLSAYKANNTASDAIAARMGMGVAGAVTSAANGAGSALWVTPTYRNSESDSFNADGATYGVDMDLFGVALGADFAVMPNLSAGMMFHVGSGSADGQGVGSAVKNDFDYYGFGAYAGYTMDAFTVTADVTWTSTDNDVEANYDLGKMSASMDSKALAVGVTGQYDLEFSGVEVSPHAGLRFTRLTLGDYTVALDNGSAVDYDAEDMNIFSIPVGVTIGKEYATETWTIRPVFDVTLTGNFGDKESKGTASWSGSNLSADLTSEILDGFTWSTSAGVAAQSGNLGMGIGLNYTGSSNVTDFGANATVRYVF